jgi:polyisoprenoid-binding protein YceI
LFKNIFASNSTKTFFRGAILAAATVVCAAAATAQAGTWQLDTSHSAAQFKVRHLMISNITGQFTKMSGTVVYDSANPAKSSVDVTIDASSVDTRVEGRDNDLRSPNFFDVAKYPTLTFKSKRVEVVSPGKLKMVGDLTMHGVTKEVTFDVDGPTQPIKDGRGNLHAGASATTRVNRKDFGLLWNRLIEGGGAVVGDDVDITMDIEMTQPAPK